MIFRVDRREFSHRECHLVRVRLEENRTARRHNQREFAVQSRQFSEKEFLQGTTGRIEEAYVRFTHVRVFLPANRSLFDALFFLLQSGRANDRRSGEVGYRSGRRGHLRGHT